MSSSSTNTAILNLLWARDTITKRVVFSLLSSVFDAWFIHLDWFRGVKRSCHRMRSFFSIFLFGKYLLFNFSSFIGTFCITECVRFCLVAVPILASDYLEFGPDDPQTRFEFGAVVVRFCASFNSSVGANRIIVTEIYFFLRKLFSLRAHWLAS